MLDQTCIFSRNLDQARAFYAAAARSLGLSVIEFDDGFALGGGCRSVLQVRRGADVDGERDLAPETLPARVWLDAPDHASARAFLFAALDAGGLACGASDGRLRVVDPDGNCIECVWRH
jgi:catechol 2,3-dioxygenase-like lactoylglutathione lyase family enzyme